MAPSLAPDRAVSLPGRPWVIGGRGCVCLVSLQGRTLVPVFRTSAMAREFMGHLGKSLPEHFYPLFPDEVEFVALLSAGLRGGATGYVLVDPDRWHVIEFAASRSTAAAPTAEPVGAEA